MNPILIAALAGVLAFLPCLAGLAAAEPGAAPVRIAVVAATNDHAAAMALVSRVEVALSGGDGIAVVEREQVRRVLAEQALGASGLADRETQVRLGAMLRADAFLFLSLDTAGSAESGDGRRAEADPLLRVRLVETAHGIRLLDWFESAATAALDETASRICGKVRGAAGKLALPPGRVVPVGIVGLRLVELGEQHQRLARTLQTLLAVRLGREDRILMLEREDLKVLMEEKAFTAGADDAFWGSAVLIDGQLRRREQEGTELRLALKRPSGGEARVFDVPVEADRPEAAAGEAAGLVLRAILETTTATAWEPAKEAREFHREGRLLHNHRRYAAAIPALETAFALDPGNADCAKAVFLAEWALRQPGRSPACTDLELAEHVVRLVRLLRREYDRTRDPLPMLPMLTEEVHDALSSNWLLEGYFEQYDRSADPRVREADREARRLWGALALEIWERHSVEDIALGKEMSFRLEGEHLVPVILCSANNSGEGLANLKSATTRLVMPPEKGGRYASADERAMNALKILKHGMDNGVLFSLRGDRIRPWVDYLRDLAGTGDAIARFYSCLGLVRGKLVPDPERYCGQALDLFERELRSPPVPFDHTTGFFLRASLCEGLRSVYKDRKVAMVDALERLYAPSLAGGDAAGLAQWDPGWASDGWTGADTEAARRHLALLEKTIPVLEKSPGDRRVRDCLARTRDVAAGLRRLLPASGNAKGPAALPVTLLSAADGWPQVDARDGARPISRHGTRYRALRKDALLWVAFRHADGRTATVRIAAFDLAEGKQVSVRNPGPVTCGAEGTLREKGPYLDLAVTGERVCLSLETVGLLAWSRSRTPPGAPEGEPRILSVKDGLPSASVTALAADGEKLWVAYGDTGKESGLGIYDPGTGAWTGVLCSTAKREGRFTSGEPYELHGLVPAPGGLFFLFDWRLWRLDLPTRGTTPVAHTLGVGGWGGGGGLHERLGLAVSGNTWLIGTVFRLVQVDAASGGTTVVAGGKPDVGPLADIAADRRPFVPDQDALTARLLDLSTAVIHGDELWALYGESGILVLHRGKSVKEAEVFDNDILAGRPALGFLSTPYGLVAIGEGAVGLITRK